MKFTVAFLLLSLFSTISFADCESQEDGFKSLNQVMSAASCQEKFNSTIDTHNEAIDFHTGVAKLRDRSDASSNKAEKCALLKEAKDLIPQAIKKYEKCFKVMKQGIIACIHTENIDTVVEAGDSCEKGQKTVESWAVSIKEEIASACKF